MFLISGEMNIPLDKRSDDREPVAAGRFYSANKETLTSDLHNLFSTCVKTIPDLSVRAIISPHAGYIFSGKIAASAFSSLSKTTYKNIFIIGSSHIISFDGASVFNTGNFITPLGIIKVNTEIGTRLKKENKHFNFPIDAHLKEHSIEVQIPFIQYYFKNDPGIVPIIIGTNNKNTIREVAAALKPYFTSENLFIISSDFSHYPSYKDAIETDRVTADAIVAKNSEIFLKTLNSNSSNRIPGLATSMCGWTSGLVLLYLSEEDPGLSYERISYCNSGDSKYGNKDEVVGYHAIMLIEENKKKNVNMVEEEFKFTGEDTEKLLLIASDTIKSTLYNKKRMTISSIEPSLVLHKNMGAFVTLKIDGKLRGCIGRFTSSDPLYKIVSQMAYSSAFEDSRFSPLTKEEFENIEIEISVLGPQKKISNIDEIIIGKHGIYIKKDFRSGTMLPQVATENGWTVEQFLGYTSRDKAGLGWTGWKDAEIYVYEAVVLKKNKK